MFYFIQVCACVNRLPLCCFQDVLTGALLSAAILGITFPYWETIDHFQLSSTISPVVGFSLPLLLSYTYPELDHYSTTRGDTITILGVGAGCSVGYWVEERLGQMPAVLPVPLPALTVDALARGVARFFIGVLLLVGTRQVVKTLSLHVLYSWYKVPKSDMAARRRKEIEVPYKFVTYASVGLVNTVAVNRIFKLLPYL